MSTSAPCVSSPVTSHQSLLRLCRGFRLRRAVPFESTRQPFLETNLRLISQIFPRLRNVGLRIADVSIARRIVLRIELLACNFFELAKNFIQGDASTYPYIENFSGNICCFARQSICLHGILDVGEVPRLLAVCN